MKKKSVFSALSELMERNKYVRYGIYGFAVLIALTLFLIPHGPDSCGKKTDADAVPHKNEENGIPEVSAEQLEAKLEKILSGIRGAGRVDVMVTYDSTSEIVCAEERESSDNETGSDKFSRPAKVSADKGEAPIILTELQPKIRGVIVIAEGAADISVKTNLMLAVSTVLGIEQSRVEVFQMGALK